MGGTLGPTNIGLPNVFSESVSQLYPIGTRFVNGDRTYHYGYYGVAVTYNTTAVANHGAFLHSWSNSYDTAYAAGELVIKMDGTSDGVPAANALSGGYLMIWTSASLGRIQMRVISNLAAEAASPYYVALTLEQATPIAIAANTGLEVYANQYADMRTCWAGANPGDYMGFVGLPPINFTAARYGWVMTWGPCFMVNSGTQTGAAAFDRQLVFDSDGSVTMADEAYNGTLSKQIAGYALNQSSSGSADQWMMLTLNP